MNFNCIVTQGHIPEFDPQGNLTKTDKLKMFNYSLEHLRKSNPNAHIILTGHGELRPSVCNVDQYYWEDRCRPISRIGYVEGMPAQYYFVDVGLEMAQKAGFDRCVKTRTDCVIKRDNVALWSENILQDEKKRLLLTQQTGEGRIGDCFLYGDLDLLRSMWHRDNPVYHADGLINTGHHFANAVGGVKTTWKNMVREHCSFRDVIDIPFLCLRWNYKEIIVDGNYLDVNKYHWGRTNNWHVFDENGKMIVTYNEDFWSKEQFYS